MDLIRRYPVPRKRWIQEMKEGRNTRTQMTTQTLQGAGYCDIVIVNPYYVGALKGTKWPTFTEKRVRKTINPTMRDKIRKWWENGVQDKALWNWLGGRKSPGKQEQEYDNHMNPDIPVSLLWTYEFTILHEVSYAQRLVRVGKY